jgi:hypothetical protein
MTHRGAYSAKGAEDAWQTRFDAYCARFQPVLGPQAGPPAGI